MWLLNNLNVYKQFTNNHFIIKGLPMFYTKEFYLRVLGSTIGRTFKYLRLFCRQTSKTSLRKLIFRNFWQFNFVHCNSVMN